MNWLIIFKNRGSICPKEISAIIYKGILAQIYFITRR